MSVELKIPEIGESISEVVIGEWLKNENDEVARDEDVVVIESDKATVEIPAPESGRLIKILKQSGATAAVGEAIGLLEKEGPKESREAPRKGREAEASKPADEEQDEENASQRLEMGGDEEHDGPEAETAERPVKDKSRPEKNDEKEAQKSGPEGQGKNTATEIEARKEESRDEGAIREEPESLQEPEDKSQEAGEHPKIISRRYGHDNGGTRRETSVPITTPRRAREEKVIPMSPIRRKIAERLVQAQHVTAFLTTFNEIDMSTVTELRRRHQEDFQKTYEIKLGLMSFFVKASIEALKQIPQVNAEIRGTDIVYRNYYDIGVAVGSGKGLVVPVLRDAAQMSFAEIEKAIQEFSRKAESNQLKPDDLEGGTFTISNGGIYGSLLSTPIINPPQSGIFGMHAIEDRPVVRDGQIVVRPMMYVALTYDHRIVDGREAVTFLKRIKECVEAPSRILLEV